MTDQTTDTIEIANDEPTNSSMAGRRVAFVGQLQQEYRDQVLDRLNWMDAKICDPDDPQVELLVICDGQLPITEHGDGLDDDLIRAAGQGQLEIISEQDLWQQLSADDTEAAVTSLYTPSMLASLLGVSVSTIRSWQRRGLIRPERQVNKLSYFNFQEITVAKQLAELVAAGVSAKTIEKNLAKLSSWLPQISRPLAQLSVLVEGKQILLRQDGGLLDTDGQQRIDFESIEQSDEPELANDQSVPSIRMEVVSNLDPTTAASDFVASAEAYEADGQYEQAIEVYRSLHLAHGPTAETCFRLGELLYLNGELQAARERYYNAIEVDESFVEARASLGCVLVELGQIDLAISAFHGALELHEEYPDVHFHLAGAYEATGETSQAIKHLRRFIELSPQSPWATEARQRLDVIRHNRS